MYLTKFCNFMIVHDIELCHTEWRSHFILDHTHTSTVSHYVLTLLDRVRTTNIQANRGVKLERFTTGSYLRITKHNANLLTQLVGKDNGSIGATNARRELTHGLTHQTSL